MKVFDQFANGKAGPRYEAKKTVVLSGKEVIILGILMLFFCVCMYWAIKREKNK